MDTTSNESSYDSSPNPARSQSKQAKRDRWKQNRRRHSRSRARSDYRSISPQSKDTAHVRSSRYPLPKGTATRTPQLDAYMKSEVWHQVKSADMNLAKVQTFLLDALAPLVSILDFNHRDHHLGFQDSIHANSTAVELIGNANTRISCMRRENVTLCLNKTLLHLFQVRVMRSAVPLRASKQFFLSAPQQLGGYYQKHGRSEASNYFQRSGRIRQQFNAQKTSEQPANLIPKQELTYNIQVHPFYNLKEIQKVR